MTREEAIAYFKRHLNLYCIEGISREAEETAIKALEQQPCEDTISRQAVLDLIEHYNSDGLGSVFYNYYQGKKFADEINKLPSVKSQIKIGHWIPAGYYHPGAYEDIYYVKCSCCGEDSLVEGDYCPNCGAKMIELQESEDKE